jgi:hypothetical protein
MKKEHEHEEINGGGRNPRGGVPEKQPGTRREPGRDAPSLNPYKNPKQKTKPQTGIPTNQKSLGASEEPENRKTTSHPPPKQVTKPQSRHTNQTKIFWRVQRTEKAQARRSGQRDHGGPRGIAIPKTTLESPNTSKFVKKQQTPTCKQITQ